MKALTVALIAAAALIATPATSAKHHETGDMAKSESTATRSIDMDVDKLVEGRRAGYWMSAGLFGGMFGIIQSDGEVTGLAFAAQALAGWAKALPGMFPEGSVNEKSNALPTIWSDREGFEATAALYAERATKLSEIAKTGDKAAFKTQWGLVRQTCSSCHDKYRRDRKKEAKTEG